MATPTKVFANGFWTISNVNVTGTNTGDQTIVLTGSISGSGTGTISTSINETSGSSLSFGSILDGQFIKRVGNAIVGTTLTIGIIPSISIIRFLTKQDVFLSSFTTVSGSLV